MSDLVANLPPAFSAPRPRILIHGQDVDKPVAIEVERTLTYQAATFRAEAALSIDSFQSWLWWDQLLTNPPVTIELLAGYLPPGAPEGSANWQSLFVGQVDEGVVDPTSGHVVLSGRDLLATLMDTQTSEQFVNQTASQIWTTLAGRHGLTPQITETSTEVQRYFAIDYTLETLLRHGRARTEWDVAVALAEIEGYDLFMDGFTLVAQPEQQPSNPYPVVWQPAQAVSGGQITAGGASNAARLRVWRDLNLSSPVKFTVYSFGAKTGKTIQASATGGGAVGKTRSYLLVHPNLTQQQAQDLANQKLQQVTRHAAGIHVELPAPDLTIKPVDGIALSGSGTSWDQTYYIDRQRIHVGINGAHMHLACKNVPPETSAQAAGISGTGADTSASSGGGGGGGGGGTGVGTGTGSGTRGNTSLSTSGSGKFNLPQGGWGSQPAAQQYSQLIQQNTPPGMTSGQFANLLGIESGFNPSITNPTTSAAGIAQVLPSTAANPGYGVSPLSNPYDPNKAIPFAGQYLTALSAQKGGLDAGVRAYSGGGYGLGDLGH